MMQNTQDDAESLSMTMDKTESGAAQPAAAEALKKDSPAKTAIKQLTGIALAGGLLWFCFKDADFNKLWHYAQGADPKFMAAVVVSGLLSHFLRAWRWVILLQPLSDKRIGLFNSFAAVMYGYAVNIVVPRGGEFARLISISKTESIPWAGVLPTMFIDRLLDIAMLVLLLGLTLSKLPPGILDPKLTGPLGILMCVATVVGLVALPFVGKVGKQVIGIDAIKSRIPEAIFSKLEELLGQFEAGTKSLTSASKLVVIAVSSVLIWICYWANMYLMIWAFHLENLVDLSKSLLVFTIGSVGVLVPTPGSVGSYHMLTSQSLQQGCGVDPSQALAFATVTHLLCFVVITCIPAAICFVIQSSANKKQAP